MSADGEAGVVGEAKVKDCKARQLVGFQLGAEVMDEVHDRKISLGTAQDKISKAMYVLCRTNRKYSWEAMLVPKRTRSSRRVSKWLMSAFRFEFTAKICRITIIKSYQSGQLWVEGRESRLTLRERMAFGGQSWQSLSEVSTSASPKVSNCSPIPRRVKVR